MSIVAQWRDQLFYQPLSLGAIALVTCTALVIGNQVTHSAIIAAEERDMQNSLSEVLPAGYGDNNLLKDTLQLTTDEGKARITSYNVCYTKLLRTEGKAGLFRGTGTIAVAIDSVGNAVYDDAATAELPRKAFGMRIEEGRGQFLRVPGRYGHEGSGMGTAS